MADLKTKYIIITEDTALLTDTFPDVSLRKASVLRVIVDGHDVKHITNFAPALPIGGDYSHMEARVMAHYLRAQTTNEQAFKEWFSNVAKMVNSPKPVRVDNSFGPTGRKAYPLGNSASVVFKTEGER